MPDHFWRNTWAENALMSEAYQTKENKEWERARQIITMIDNLKRSKSFEPKGDIDKLKELEENMANANWVPLKKL